MFQRTRDYAKDYEQIGSTVRYIGKHYRLTLEQPAQNRRKAAYVFSLIAAFVLFVAVGFSGSPALGAGGGATPMYVVLPYVVLLLPLGLGLARAVLLAAKSKPLEHAEFDKYMVQQKGVLLGSLVVCGLLILGELVFLFFGGAGLSGQWLVIGESALLCTCIFLAFRQYHALFTSVAIDEGKSVRYDI
jgi:hypothetical protein